MTTGAYARAWVLSRLHQHIYTSFQGAHRGALVRRKAHKNQFRYFASRAPARGTTDGSHKQRSVNFSRLGRIAALSDVRFWPGPNLPTDPSIVDGSEGLPNRPPAARAGGAIGGKLGRGARRLETDARGRRDCQARSRARRRRAFALVSRAGRAARRRPSSSCHRSLSTLRLAGRAANGRALSPLQRSARGAS